VGLVEALAGGLVFDEQAARPEQINEAPIAGELLDQLLKGGDGAAPDAEDVEEVVPEGLALGGLPRFALPFSRLKAMARWRISFHDSGMGGGYHAPSAKRQKFPCATGLAWG
jgi:hypothetical protein